MERILEMADRLGKLIAKDPRTVKLAEARAALDGSLENRQLLADFEKQQQKVYSLEGQGKPIEPEDKRALADLHAKVVGSEVLKGLMTAQADYVELMTHVSRHIEQASLGKPEQTSNERHQPAP